jgi:hypothetical protein
MFRLIVTICAFFSLVIPHYALGKDLSSMYGERALSSWKERYSENINWNFEHVIKQALTPQEREFLENVNLEFPLIGNAREPFEYYAKVEYSAKIKNLRRSVVVPIFSIKFLDDLAIAGAWLAVRGFGFPSEVIREYVAMLKYKKASEFPTGNYSPPLKALHIPETPLDDPTVDDIAQKIVKLSIVYVICRELGHLYLNRHLRPPATMKENIDEAIRSDTFAMEILRRIGTPPILTYLFNALVVWVPNRSDFSDEKSYEKYLGLAPNPLTPERLNHLADLMVRGQSEYARGQTNRHAAEISIESEWRYILRLATFLECEQCQVDVKTLALTKKIKDLYPVFHPH